MIRGSCCCGKVRFTLAVPPTMMAACHCTRCRKVGASTFVFIHRDSFAWVAGETEVTHCQPGEGYQHVRSFCRHCGTALGEIGSSAETYPIAADCLDDDPGLRIRFHEFVAEKPAWATIGDDAPQFPLHPRKTA